MSDVLNFSLLILNYFFFEFISKTNIFFLNRYFLINHLYKRIHYLINFFNLLILNLSLENRIIFDVVFLIVFLK